MAPVVLMPMHVILILVGIQNSLKMRNLDYYNHFMFELIKA